MKLNLVPARTGTAWVRSGLQTFARRPLAFLSLFMLFMAVASIVSQVPLLGPLLALMLLPAMTLGLMAATRHASTAGLQPNSAGLFVAAYQAVRASARPLAVLGALYAVLFLMVVGVSALVDGGQFARVYLLGEQLNRELAESAAVQGAFWLAMALYLPVSLAFWHAPALVHWHGVAPVKSLFFSFVACFRNFGALTIFGLAWAGVFVASFIVLILIATLLAATGIFGGSSEGIAAVMGGTLMVGQVLIMTTMFFASLWFSFRDSFEDGEPADASR